jgi:metal-responsive CopG/Arc/MetJ family transcriptional regulator
MERMQRFQILLKSEQHQALAELARRQGISLSALTREIIDHYLANFDDQRRRERAIRAIHEIVATREQIRQQFGNLPADFSEDLHPY